MREPVETSTPAAKDQEAGGGALGGTARGDFSALLLQVTLSMAAALARGGRYDEAEACLADVIHGENTQSAALHLLARMRAQQGRFSEAESLWTQAARLDPGTRAYAAGIQRIHRLQAKPLISLAWVLPRAALVLALVLVAGLTVLFMNRQVSGLRTAIATDVARQQAERSDQITGLEAAVERLATAFPGAKPPPELKLEIAGVDVNTQPGLIEVRFDSGLFEYGTMLTSQAEQLLTILGLQLEPYVGRITIAVIGCTDDLPVRGAPQYLDNIGLGRRRAGVVIDYLRATSRLPDAMFTIQSSTGLPSPYANDSAANRAGNRTAVLRISPVTP